MRTLFISDIHLTDAQAPKTKSVLDLLQGKGEGEVKRWDQIFILGDLFDVWPGTTPYLISTFDPVLRVFRKLIEQGCQIHYIEGNHDFRLGSYFTEKLGIRVHSEQFEAEMGGKRIYLAHGDLGNPKEKGYRVLRALLRSHWLHFMIRPIPAKWIYWLGQQTSQASRGYQKLSDEKVEMIRKVYRETATQLFHQGYDVVIMGHTHLPEDVSIEVNQRQCRYLNTGDWLVNFTYLEFDGKEFYTRVHSLRNR